MWSSLLFILWLIHSAVARPQDLLTSPPSFLPENQLEESSGTQLIASGDASSDSNQKIAQQEEWTEDPKPILIADASCNDAVAAPNQVLHSRFLRSQTFTRRGGGEICIPDDRTQFSKQPEESQPPGRDAAQPLPLDPASGKPKRPGKRKKPGAKGISADALPMHNAIYNFPGEDGKPDYEVCNISQYRLLRVPICAPPQPYSPISMVLPARFWQSSVPCDKAIGENLWCCLTARQPFHELSNISDGPPPPIIQAYPAVGFTCAIVV